MKKRDPKKQAKLQKITTKRAAYTKARKQAAVQRAVAAKKNIDNAA